MTHRANTNRPAAAAFIVLLLAGGCAHTPPTAPIAEVVPVEQAPILPVELTSVVPPVRAADGSYLTINHGVDALQAMWHVRAALNVAAIGCRGPQDATLISTYNSLLKVEKASLARANASVEASFRKSYGAGWQNAHDAYMTRLYNFFAQPFAKPAFCATAGEIATQAAAASPSEFATLAPVALGRLEAPFVDGYARIDAYRTQFAAYDARRARGAASVEVATIRATPATPPLLKAPVELASNARTVASSDLASPMMALVTPIRTRTVTHTVIAAPAPIVGGAMSVAPAAGPQLHYADVKMLLAWQPSQTERVALR